MKEREAKTLLAGVDAYYVSGNGEKVLLRQGKTWKVAPAAEIKPESATPLPVDAVSVLIDPRQEWRQIMREAWRLNRDYLLRTELSRRRLECACGGSTSRFSGTPQRAPTSAASFRRW